MTKEMDSKLLAKIKKAFRGDYENMINEALDARDKETFMKLTNIMNETYGKKK